MALRRRTLVLASAAGLLLMLAGFAGAIVTLTQTDRGRALIVRVALPLARRAIPGSLHVGAIHGTLFSDITIDSLDIRAPDGTPFLTTGPIRLTYDPRDLLDARIVVKSLEVMRPQVTLVDYGSDDWNWKRALRKPGRRAQPPGRGRFGQWIVIDTTTLHELTFVARLPWTLSDTLKGAKRDSALTYNLTRLDGEIRRDGDRLVRVYRFARGNVALGRSSLAHPRQPGQQFAVQRLDVVWVYPPFWFRDMRGTIRKLGDSLFVDTVKFALPKSRAEGAAKVVWGGNLPVRYDVRLRLDTVAMTDLAWIDETIPHSGGGRAMLRMRNDPRNLNIIDYAITQMDASALKSRITGDMTWGVGGFVTRLSDVDLALQPAHTDLLRWFNGEPFPYDWRGRISGRVRARGGFVTQWQLDEATVRFDDEHVPGAVSRARAVGSLNIFSPAEAILQGVDLDIERLDFRTPRFVNPMFAELNGFARGRVRLDSLWYDAFFSRADVELVDGPGQPSRFTGAGRYTLVPEGVVFDVDMQAAPLSYTTLSRSYTSMPLRGSAIGRIRAKGMADRMELTTTLAGEGGELSFAGTADALEPTMGATGAWRVRGANIQSLFGDARLPVTALNMSGTVDLYGVTNAAGILRNDSFVGPLRATVEEFSRIADARVYGGNVALRFDAGVLRVDTLTMESSAVRLTANGGVAFDRQRRDSLSLTMYADSLGGLRPWITAMTASGTPWLLPTDTLRGTAQTMVRLAGSVDTLDTQGLDLDLRGDLAGMVVAGTRSMRAGFDLQAQDVLRSLTGRFQLQADSARLAGLDVATLSMRATLRDGLAERFAVAMRTPSESRISVGGQVARDGDDTRVRVDTLTIRVDSGWTRPRGFQLVEPATLRLGVAGGGTLDGLTLQHTDTGRVSVRGALTAEGAVQGTLEAERLPLYDLGRLLQASGLTQGTASATLAVRGTRDQPRIDGRIALNDAVAGRLRFGDLIAEARYDSTRLTIDGALRVGGREALRGTARLPVDLALRTLPTRRLEAPLEGRVRAERADLAVMASMFPEVTGARGVLESDVRLTGTWARPRLRGRIQLDSAGFSLANLGIRLDRAAADIRLDGDTIAIRRFRASSGLDSDSIGLSGIIGITEITRPDVDLRLAANNFLAIDKPRSATVAITTTAPLALTGTGGAPTLRGALRLDRGRVYISQLAQRRALDLSDDVTLIDSVRLGVNALLPSAPSTLVQNLALDNVRLQVGEDVWLRSPEANLKLGGQLRVTRSSRDGQRARLALADSLTVQRGTYQLNLGLARPGFEVERGLVRFFGDPDLEPTLDITALHTVRETRANSNRQDVRIRVNIGGTLDRPTLALTSADNPPLPESDMLSYLVTGEPAYALLGTPYAEQGATLALRLAGSYLSSRLAGGRFDVVQVEPTALNPGDAANLRQNGLGILASTRVGVGGQVARNTYFTFSTGLCGLAPQANGGGDALSLFAQGLGVKVERRFERGLSLSVGLEPASSAQACGRLGISRTFQQTPPQVGIDFFRFWTF